MIVIKTSPYNSPSYQAIFEFESSFENITYINETGRNRVIKRIFNLIINKKILKRFSVNNNKENVFIVLMNTNDLYKLIPIYLKNRNVSIYIYDLLKFQYDLFFDITNYLEIKNIFFSSKDTTDYFNSKYKSNTKYYWIPEAVKIDEYNHEEYSKKDIDIISFGRRYEIYHNKIMEGNFKYLYKKSVEPLFEKHKDLINNLAKAKISICFPSDLTNPSHFESISKVTMRYFQSMMCKCLILGKSPNDMKYLFNYDPVIKADLDNPLRQIENILNNYDKYIDLIETNYNEVVTKHKYIDRINKIYDLIV